MINDKCNVELITKRPGLDEIQNVRVAFLNIWGMGCPSCANRVHNTLVALNGVVDARVNHVDGKAQVVYNPNLATSDDLIVAVGRASCDEQHQYGAQKM
jgi:copper chaperone CopZ